MRTKTFLGASLLLLALAPGLPAQELAERAAYRQHAVAVRWAALSPDAKLVASGGGDTRRAEVMLWDATSGREDWAPAIPGGPVDALVFSPDGKRLAVAANQEARVWDVNRRAEIATCKKFGEAVLALAFSGDGKRLAGAGWQNVKSWDADSGKELSSFRRTTNTYAGPAFGFSRDLHTLAAPNYQEIELWDLGTGERRAFLSEHRGEVCCSAFTPDGRTLLAASAYHRDGTGRFYGDIRLWDLAARQERAVFQRDLGRVLAVRLSPDGRTLAALNWDSLYEERNVKLLDVATGRQKTIPAVPAHSFLSVGFTPAGRLFVTGTNDDNVVRIWEVVPPRVPEK